MSLSLYTAVIPSYLQMLGAMQGLIAKAERWCEEKQLAPAELLERRLAPDMQPLSYQFKSTVVHSLGAIEGVQRGSFSPDFSELPASFGPLRDRIGAAIDALNAIDPKTVEGFVGRDMAFVFGEHRIAFEAHEFLLSFAQPNFYFHCTTAYDILRVEGLDIGKRDFMGRQRRKPG